VITNVSDTAQKAANKLTNILKLRFGPQYGSRHR
jgi:hypothetical protein